MFDEERHWTEENINTVALKHFPNIDRETALKRPILYSCWLSKDYVPVDQEELREYVKARLKVRDSLNDKPNLIHINPLYIPLTAADLGVFHSFYVMLVLNSRVFLL